jgi:hypothetical protein
MENRKYDLQLSHIIKKNTGTAMEVYISSFLRPWPRIGRKHQAKQINKCDISLLISENKVSYFRIRISGRIWSHCFHENRRENKFRSGVLLNCFTNIFLISYIQLIIEFLSQEWRRPVVDLFRNIKNIESVNNIFCLIIKIILHMFVDILFFFLFLMCCRVLRWATILWRRKDFSRLK